MFCGVCVCRACMLYISVLNVLRAATGTPCGLQGWGLLAEQLVSSGADGLIMARPISSPAEYCPLQQQQQQSPGTSSACSPLLTGDGGIAGRVGPCCDSESSAPCEDNHAHAAEGQGAQHQHHHHHHHQPGAAAETSGYQGEYVRYYGLVVLSKSAAKGATGCSKSGCYVLKTSSSSPTGSDGCRCTHYTLTQVCRGQPLQSQMQAAWLV